MQAKIYDKRNKYILLGLFTIIVLALSWLVIITFTSKVEDSSWDGVIANSFTSGTGSNNNPYVISSSGELAYFKQLMESDSASLYANKNYVINASLNYGNYELTINNQVPFSGVIDGKGNFIDNVTINNSLFNSVENATIKNITIKDITYEKDEEVKGLFVNTSNTSTYNLINLEVLNNTNTNYAGFINEDNGSNIDNVVINLNNEIKDDIYSLIYTSNNTNINSALVNKDYQAILNDNSSINNITYYELVNNVITLDDFYFINDNYTIELVDNHFVINQRKDTAKARLRGAISLHDSGIDGNSVYVNDLQSDYDYYMGQNFSRQGNGSLPNGEAANIYSDNNLVKVYIHYSGVSINDENEVSYISNSENQSELYYYKYYPLNGSTLTFELIDNPFSKRPNNRAFNGWVTDYDGAIISFDKETYTRYVTINNVSASDTIEISFNATYTDETLLTTTSSVTNAITNNLKSGMVQYVNQTERVYEDLTQYYVSTTIYRGDYYVDSGEGVWNTSGQRITSATCSPSSWWSSTCTYLIRAGSEYDSSISYYRLQVPANGQGNATVTRITPSYTEIVVPFFDADDIIAGNFKQVTKSRNNNIDGLYDSNGNMQSGNCNSSTCTLYELLQYDAVYSTSNNYYYLATRDTNIYAPSGNISSSFTVGKPLTMTGLHNGTLNASRRVSSTITVNQDFRIENMTFAASTLSGRNQNIKVGRNVSTTSSSAAVQGGYSNTSSNYKKYKTIVESGNYANVFSTSQSSNSASSTYGHSITIVGSDYDRVNNDNSKLTISTRLTPGQVVYVYGTSQTLTTDIHNEITVKSGRIGTSETSELTAGIYMGILGGGGITVATNLTIEGGYIVKIIGGVSRNTSWENKNFSYINVKGGTIDSIIGGASYGTTQGNRIMSITGGEITYSVFGGSNGAYVPSNSYNALLESSTFINVGGHATIGTTNSNLVYRYNNTSYPNSTVEPGSIFGAGNGKTNNLDVGRVTSSIIVVNDNATINGNIYGGGNNGRVGISGKTPSSKIIINSGTVNGSVYGGGNNNGSGQSGLESTVNVIMNGGTVGNLYGGSNISGTLYGASHVTINGGEVTRNVYGGGEGNNTYVSRGSNVTIGTAQQSPTINGSVYGGSAFGTVNSSDGNTVVTVNNGLIKGSIFGGGEGNNSYTPSVNGNITVNINGGDITSVYGGHDQAGSHNGTNNVYLKGGIIENAFGGGNKSNVTTTNIHLQGSTVTNVYGGSNLSGTVQNSHVNINSGSVGNVYGGNNKGGNCYTTNVEVEGTAEVLTAIYGGGNEVDTTTTNLTLTSANNTIPSVYGGGNKSGVSTVLMTKGNVSVTNLFGGSNSSGTVSQSYITHNGGTTTYLYGGNNKGGTTISSNIYYNNGNSNTIYGGGNEANSQTSSIMISNGTVSKIFGGGNKAGVTTTNVTLYSGTLGEVYGGSNESGLVGTTNLSVNTSVGSIYGGGNYAETNDTNITVTTGTINYIYGGGNLARVNNNTTLNISNATINNDIYGGGNYGVVKGSSNLKITNSNITGSIYGGGNGESAILEGNTVLNIEGSTTVGSNTSVAPYYGSIFGGGNKAYTGTITNNNSTTTLNIAGATIYGNVYGGANTSVVYGDTHVNIGVDTIANNTLQRGDIYIKGHIFGGGEANAEGSENYDWYFISVTQGTNININGNGYTNFDILGSFYGGGNASSASGVSNLNISNYGASENPKANVSIQRVTNATLNSSSILLKGAIDRANDYDTELFAISRVENLNLKNNSEIYFVTGANLLENLNSLDSSDNPAEVTIDEDTGTVTKTVDNRVYVYEGRNLNIARDQQVTEYGKITGMSFFGLFNYRHDNEVNVGNYSKQFDNGDELSWNGTFTRGSYVLGEHQTNHDITVDGFYSNFMNEETLINEVKYIEPTPTDARFYMWFIGENLIEYNVNLTASKYSTLGSTEVSFLEFTDPNTSFEILNFDYSELDPNVSLVEKSEIRRIAYSEYDANRKFGLTMEASNTGWLTTGKTSFYSSDPSMDGTTYYEGENSTLVPTMLFYLYHSKNLTEQKDLGTVRISVMAITKKSALQNEVRRLVINVHMSTALFQTVEYEGAMTPGERFELFASTSTNITTKSKLSAYYSLYGENENLYRNGYHRVLTSTFVLPLNTKITMIDYANWQNNYYYHVIDETDIARTTAEFNQHNEASYALSMFTRMGSLDPNNHYDDAQMNNNYYDGTNSSEEFIFIVDFSDTNITSDKLSNKLLIEIRDENDESIITVLGIEHGQLTYNLYHDRDSDININVTPSDNPLYIGYTDIFDVSIDYQNQNLDNIGVIDTQYFNSKLGIQISIVNKDGNTISGTDLVGTYFEMDGNRYYPDVNGITRIKLSDKVGNTEKWIMFNTANSSIATGDYTFVFQTFGSIDGIYYGDNLPKNKNLDIIIINSKYGLNPVINDNSIIFSSTNDKNLKFTIDYTSMLDNPNIRLALYRRRYDQIYDTNYDLVDLADYVDQTLFATENEKEYLLVSNPNPENSFNLSMKQELMTGTYRLVFRLYDNDVLIGDITRYIIIK